MSEIISRWPVRLSLPIDASDRDDNGCLTDGAIERCFAAARDAYFARCSAVDASMTEVESLVTTPGSPAETASITIAVAVVEVYPDAFTMEARLRPGEGEGIAAQARCRLTIAAGVTEAIRDEFIALAHAARYTH